MTCYGLFPIVAPSPDWPGVLVATTSDGGATFGPIELETTTGPTGGDSPTAESTPSPAGPATSFGDGIYAVDVDIAPGTYRAEGGGSRSCYWARLSGFSGDDIITNDIGDGPRIVEIQPSDAGFESSGCGQWTLAS